MTSDKLIPAENFEAFRVKNLIVEVGEGSKTVRVSGWAILDKRVDKLVSFNDKHFYSLRTKKALVQAIDLGLFDGFSHFDHKKLGTV